MKLFNLFFKTKDEQVKDENTADKIYKSAKKKLNDFVDLTDPITKERKRVFDNLMAFTLEGDQWTYSEIKDLDGDMDLTFNFSEDYLERYIARLFPRNPHTGVLEVGVKVFGGDKQEKYERDILDFYKFNNIVSVILEQSTNYLVGGSAVLYYPKDPVTGKAVLISLDPKVCYFGWKGNQLVQFAYKEYVGDNKHDIFYWDMHEFLHYKAKEDKYYRQKNEFNFIPVSWIPNKPKPHKHEGRSKILALYNLDRAYNFAATDYSRRVKDNTEPPLIVRSNDVSLSAISRGRKKKTKIGKEDSMEYLELKEGKEVLDYLEMLEQKIKTKAGIVDSSGAVKSGISGLSLSYQYSDMMDLIGFMRVAWDSAFRELNSAVLSYEHGEADYKTDPVYHPFLSFDNKQRVEEYAIMIENKLISRRDAIDELRGVENADEKVDEIIEESKKFEKPTEPKPKGEDENINS